jgi:hypothetical protein
MALRGMPSYSVDSGVCAITMPPSPLIARAPRRAFLLATALRPLDQMPLLA